MHKLIYIRVCVCVNYKVYKLKEKNIKLERTAIYKN